METTALEITKIAIDSCNPAEKLSAAKYAIESIPQGIDLSALKNAILELEILIATLKDE